MKISLLSIYPDIQSYGIRTISSCLKREGHDVDLFFLTRQFLKRFENKTMDGLVKLTKGSDLIGISLMSNFWDNAVQITTKLKEHYETPILWGGTHATIRPEECLEHADMVCIGEGEEALVELTRKMQKGEYYYDTKGMGFKTNEKKINNGHRSLPGSQGSMFKSLDEIPFQDYDYKSHYALSGGHIKKMDLNDVGSYGGIYMTQPTRGCPFACTFCVNNTTLKMYPHQKPIRKRSIDHLINELLEVKAKLPFVDKMKFDDDAFFITPLEDMKYFGKQYKEKIKLPLQITGATPSTLTRDKLAVLVDAGLSEIRMGIQTAGERTKILYKRPHTNEQVENCVKMVNEYKDKVTAMYDIILDSPWDTEEDTKQTLMFLSKLPPPFGLSLFSLLFYPGTDLYRKAKEEGIVKDDVNDVYRKYYHGCKKTYLNDLYFLLTKYTLVGVGISPKIMSILINDKIRKLHIHRVLYGILKILYPFFRIKELAQKAFKDILKGDLTRIKKYLRKNISIFSKLNQNLKKSTT